MSNIYQESENRNTANVFSSKHNPYVNQNNQVRAIDDYVEMLDTAKLGFTNANLLIGQRDDRLTIPNFCLYIFMDI